MSVMSNIPVYPKHGLKKQNNTFSDSSHSKSLDLGGIYDWKNVNLIIKLQVYLFSSHEVFDLYNLYNLTDFSFCHICFRALQAGRAQKDKTMRHQLSGYEKGV